MEKYIVLKGLIEVDSTAIQGYAYTSGVLTIQMRKGGLYHYHKVPAIVYQGLVKAESKGAYFNQYIKDKYSFNPLVRDAG